MSLRSSLSESRATVLAFSVLGAGWGAIAALVPDLKAGLNADDALFGRLLLASAAGLLTALWIAPRFDRRMGSRAMPLAVIFLGFAFTLPGLAQGVLAFAGAMAVVGIASGLTDVVINVRVSERESVTGQSLMNLNHAMFSFAYAAGALWTGVARELDLAAVWPLSLVTVCAILAVRWMGQPVADASVENNTKRLPVRSIVVTGGAIVLIAFLVENGIEIWSALHIERTLGGRAAEGALGPAILGLTMGVGRLSGQVVAERLREETVIVVAALFSAVGLLVAAAAQTPLVAYLGFGIAGLGVSVVAPMALALIGKRVPPEMRSVAISRAAVIGFSGFFIGPPILGAVSESFGLRFAFLPCVALLLVVPFLVRITKRSYQQNAARSIEARGKS